MKKARQFPAWPAFDRATDRRVLKILHSGRVNYWTGSEGRLFEREFASWLGVRHACAVSNGTAALHLALEALDIGAGDEVICTPYSFRASATCVANAGAKPIFADVGEDHMLTAETIARVLSPRTRAIIVVHLYGQVADMGPILRLARQHGLKVIEDCAQCLGGEWKGRKVGTFGDVGCFSFCQSKHITAAGEGGMVVCRSATIARAVMSLRDHGWKVGSEPKTFDRVGYNFRLTEIQSAVARGELKRLDSWNLPRRRRLAQHLLDGLKGHPLVRALPVDTPMRRASFWLVPIVLKTEKLKVPIRTFIEALQKEGAGAYRILWPLMASRPRARKLLNSTVGFWVHPTYEARQIRADLEVFCRVAKRLSK